MYTIEHIAAACLFTFVITAIIFILFNINNITSSYVLRSDKRRRLSSGKRHIDNDQYDDDKNEDFDESENSDVDTDNETVNLVSGKSGEDWKLVRSSYADVIIQSGD